MKQVRQGPAVIAPRDYMHNSGSYAGVLAHSQTRMENNSEAELSLENKGKQHIDYY
jgi:hypothetical protein